MAKEWTEEYYKELICNRLRPKFIKELEPDADFLNIMRENNYMPESMHEAVERMMSSDGRQAAAAEFLNRLKKRPFVAFHQLMKALYETGHEQLLMLIQKTLYDDVEAEIQAIVDIVCNKESLENVEIERGMAIDRRSMNCYPSAVPGMRRGKVIIVNNRNILGMNDRAGSEHDLKNLLNFFTNQCRFEVKYDTDLTQEKVINFLKEQSQNLEEVEVLIVILMSHGCDNAVYDTGGVMVKIYPDITSIFSETNCPSMAGKPKLFFIQACQKGSSGVSNVEWNLDYDMLLAMATVEGSLSYRCPCSGSYFIRAMICVFAKYSFSDHMDELVTKIMKVVSCMKDKKDGLTQLSKKISNLRKQCYLT